MTVFENVFTAAAHGGGLERERAYEATIESLALTGMTAVANRRAETLGLIDRKRLELARALATDPAVLLLDEIGGGLTDAEANELVDIILELKPAASRSSGSSISCISCCRSPSASSAWMRDASSPTDRRKASWPIRA